MPKFLSQDELYRLIQRELPAFVFPDGPPTAFYWTSEAYSYAKNFSSAYENASGIYDQFFPQTATSKIDDWDIKIFGQLQDASLSLQQRRDILVSHIQNSPPDLGLWSILVRVLDLLPVGTVVQLFEYCSLNKDAGWKIGVSLLGINTFLGFEQFVPEPGSGFDFCNPDPVPSNWTEEQNFAYGYECRVFNYTLSDQEYAKIDSLLKRLEPARSNHTIRDNLTLSDFGLVVEYENVVRADNLTA